MKKIFTLIALAVMALGVNAQTTIDLAGLKTTDFTYDASDFATGTYEVKINDGDAEKTTVEVFNYVKKDKNNWSPLILTGKNVEFHYKNKDEKTNIFQLWPQCLNVNGKDSRIVIKNATAGEVITLLAASKGTTASVFAAKENCTADENNPADAGAKQTDPANFTEFKFTAAAAGDVVIQETGGGFNLATITRSGGEGGGEEVVDPTPAKTWDFSVTSENDKVALAADTENWTVGNEGTRYSNAKEIDKDTDVELKAGDNALEGFAGLLAGRSGGKIGAGNLRIDIDNRFQINASNGYIKVLNLKKDDLVYVDFSSASTTEEERTITVNIGTGENLSSNLNTDRKIGKITLNASGDLVMSQSKGLNFYKIYVNPSEVPTVPEPDGINVVNVNTISTGAIYNLAGQKVSEDYKGVVIQNGKKMIK